MDYTHFYQISILGNNPSTVQKFINKNNKHKSLIRENVQLINFFHPHVDGIIIIYDDDIDSLTFACETLQTYETFFPHMYFNLCKNTNSFPSHFRNDKIEFNSKMYRVRKVFMGNDEFDLKLQNRIAKPINHLLKRIINRETLRNLKLKSVLRFYIDDYLLDDVNVSNKIRPEITPLVENQLNEVNPNPTYTFLINVKCKYFTFTFHSS